MDDSRFRWIEVEDPVLTRKRLDHMEPPSGNESIVDGEPSRFYPTQSPEGAVGVQPFLTTLEGMLLLQSRECSTRWLSYQVGFDEIDLVLVRDMHGHVGAMNRDVIHVLLEKDVCAAQAVKSSLMNEMKSRKWNIPSSSMVSKPTPSYGGPRLPSCEMAANAGTDCDACHSVQARPFCSNSIRSFIGALGGFHLKLAARTNRSARSYRVDFATVQH